MPVQPIKLWGTVGTLQPVDVDTNFTNLKNFSNGLEARVNAALDSTGNILKSAIPLDTLAYNVQQLLDNTTIGFDPTSPVLAGTLSFVGNPADGDTLVLSTTISGPTTTTVQVQFVSALGTTAGNVLIGASAQATAANLIGLLRNPLSTSTTAIALASASPANLSSYGLDGIQISVTGGSTVTALAFSSVSASLVWTPVLTGRIQMLSAANPQPPATNSETEIHFTSVSTVGINARSLVLRNASNLAYVAESVALSANITVSGINGLDANSEMSTNWYYIWVIYNGTTVASLLSLSSTAPTLPTGYTYKALVGVVYNSSGGDFLPFQAYGRKVYIVEQSIAISGATSGTSVMTGIVPPIARAVFGNFGAPTGVSGTRSITISGMLNGIYSIGKCACCGTCGASLDGFTLAAPYQIATDSSITITWATADTGNYLITVSGYEW